MKNEHCTLGMGWRLVKEDSSCLWETIGTICRNMGGNRNSKIPWYGKVKMTDRADDPSVGWEDEARLLVPVYGLRFRTDMPVTFQRDEM